jgi:hypothetical protein
MVSIKPRVSDSSTKRAPADRLSASHSALLTLQIARVIGDIVGARIAGREPSISRGDKMDQTGSDHARKRSDGIHPLILLSAALVVVGVLVRLQPARQDKLFDGASGGAANDDDFLREFAAKRSHQDAQAANEHAKLADQFALGINGAAATAILAFSSASSSIFARGSLSVAVALGFFAFGAALGAAAMRAHSKALAEWLYFWSVRAGVRDPFDAPENDTPEKNYMDALRRAKRHDWYIGACITCFLLGCVSFGMAIVNPFHQAP